ncbi:MAG: hypothetical protein ABEJ30_09690 [Halorientalis sp.]
MSHATAGLLERARPDRETLLWGALVVHVELLVLALWWLASPTRLLGLAGLRYWLYPFVWINVALFAVVRVRPSPAPARRRTLAAAVAVGYVLVLGYVGGLYGPAMPSPPSLRVAVLSIPPGWGPALLYSGPVLSVTLLPFKVIGYAALGYLLYATVVDAAGAAVSGLLGLLSCVSCTWPVLASLAAGLAGGGAGLAGAVYGQSYGLSTAVFVLTVALLSWRPRS